VLKTSPPRGPASISSGEKSTLSWKLQANSQRESDNNVQVLCVQARGFPWYKPRSLPEAAMGFRWVLGATVLWVRGERE